MKLAAVMLVLDEADIVAGTIEHLLEEGVDRVYVLDNLSTDGTRDVLFDVAARNVGKVVVGVDSDPGYWQSKKTTALADRARSDGYDWVIPCDADEWWYSSFGSLRSVIQEHDRAGYDLIRAQLWDHVPTGADDLDETDPFARISWRFGFPGRLHKVACRLRPDLTIEMGNHSATFQMPSMSRLDAALALRHFTWRTEDQYVRKIRNGWNAYAHTTMPPTVGGHWRMFGPPDEETWEERVRAHFYAWFYVANPPDDRPDLQLVFDPISVPVAR